MAAVALMKVARDVNSEHNILQYHEESGYCVSLQQKTGRNIPTSALHTTPCSKLGILTSDPGQFPVVAAPPIMDF